MATPLDVSDPVMDWAVSLARHGLATAELKPGGVVGIADRKPAARIIEIEQ
jgi:hypothetical protein